MDKWREEGTVQCSQLHIPADTLSMQGSTRSLASLGGSPLARTLRPHTFIKGNSTIGPPHFEAVPADQTYPEMLHIISMLLMLLFFCLEIDHYVNSIKMIVIYDLSSHDLVR